MNLSTRGTKMLPTVQVLGTHTIGVTSPRHTAIPGPPRNCSLLPPPANRDTARFSSPRPSRTMPLPAPQCLPSLLLTRPPGSRRSDVSPAAAHNQSITRPDALVFLATLVTVKSLEFI